MTNIFTHVASSISLQKAACYNSVKRVLTNAFDHSIQFLFMGDLVGCLFQRNSGYQIDYFCILYLSLCVVLFPSINRVMVKLKKREKIFGNFGDFWLKSVPRGPKHSDKKSRKIPGFQFQKSRDFG